RLLLSGVVRAAGRLLVQRRLRLRRGVAEDHLDPHGPRLARLGEDPERLPERAHAEIRLVGRVPGTIEAVQERRDLQDAVAVLEEIFGDELGARSGQRYGG